jgi:hypothetical protein
MYIIILILAVVAVVGFFMWIAGDVDNAVGYWETWKNEPQEKETEE